MCCYIPHTLSLVSVSPMALWSLDTCRLSHLWPYALHSNLVNKVDFKCLTSLIIINNLKIKMKSVRELAGREEKDVKIRRK